MNSLMSQL